jgi:hypothetical protein
VILKCEQDSDKGGDGIFEQTVPESAWKYLGKPRKTSVRITHKPDNISKIS